MCRIFFFIYLAIYAIEAFCLTVSDLFLIRLRCVRLRFSRLTEHCELRSAPLRSVLCKGTSSVHVWVSAYVCVCLCMPMGACVCLFLFLVSLSHTLSLSYSALRSPHRLQLAQLVRSLQRSLSASLCATGKLY